LTARRMALRLVQKRAFSARAIQHRRYSTALPKFISNPGPAKLTSLPNGVRVVSEESVGAASVQLWVRGGASHETAQTNGVAGVLQRLSVQSKAADLAKFGGKLTGSTCREYTVYTAEVLPQDVPHAVTALGQIASGINFTDAAIEQEKASTLKSLSGLVDTWTEQTMTDHLFAAAYQGTTVAHSAGGDPGAVKGLGRAQLDAFRAAQYTGHNIVLSINGPEAQNAATAFGQIGAGPTPAKGSRVDFTGSQMNIRDDTVHAARITIGYETVGLSNKNWAALKILQNLLGSWDVTKGLGNNSSSRLSELIANEKLADSFSTFNHQLAETGIFGVHAVTHNVDQLDDLVYEIFNEYQKLYEFLYENDLKRAVNQVTNNYLTSIATPTGRAADAGRQVSTFGRRMTPAEAVARFRAVKLDEVQELIESYFNDVDPVVISHGPLDEMPDYGILRGWTYWNRR